MKGKAVRIAIILAILVAGMSMAATAGAADGEIPQGSTITSATFSIFVNHPSGQTVNLHEIVAAWSEDTVTWDNFGGYNPNVIGSFVADSSWAWRSASVLPQVQAWVNGSPNFGLLLEQGPSYRTIYLSSESIFTERRPKLEVCYEHYWMGADCVTIQRPGDEQDGVADALISELYPYSNGGASPELITGLIAGWDKISLVRFEIPVVPPDGEGCTPGYWKQPHHLESWASTGYATGDIFDTVFGVSYFGPTYTLGDAIKAKGGGLNVLARHGTAALLSAAHPAVDYPFEVAEVITLVQDGNVDPLVEANELGCPLN